MPKQRDVEYEFGATADKLQLYMRDHGKPVAVAGMAAKVTLLAGSDKQDVQLQPGDGKLEASGSFKVPAGTESRGRSLQGGQIRRFPSASRLK